MDDMTPAEMEQRLCDLSASFARTRAHVRGDEMHPELVAIREEYKALRALARDAVEATGGEGLVLHREHVEHVKPECEREAA